MPLRPWRRRLARSWTSGSPLTAVNRDTGHWACGHCRTWSASWGLLTLLLLRHAPERTSSWLCCRHEAVFLTGHTACLQTVCRGRLLAFSWCVWMARCFLLQFFGSRLWKYIRKTRFLHSCHWCKVWNVFWSFITWLSVSPGHAADLSCCPSLESVLFLISTQFCLWTLCCTSCLPS